MTWRPIGRFVKPSTVTVELDFESVEFIATELPWLEGFTRDWWDDIYLPMVALREEAGLEAIADISETSY